MESEKLIEKFKEYGFETPNSVAEELIKRKIYNENSNVRAYLYQVMTGRRNPSEKLISGLVNICSHDISIREIIDSNKDNNLCEVRKSFNSLMRVIRNSPPENGISFSSEIKDYLDNYYSRLLKQ